MEKKPIYFKRYPIWAPTKLFVITELSCNYSELHTLKGEIRNIFDKNSIFQIHIYISSVQLLSHVRLFATPWTTVCQASLSITNSWSPHKPMSTESVMPSNHLILCQPLLLPPSIFPSIRFFSNESFLCSRRPKYWSFSFSISPSNEHPGLISFRVDWLDLLAVQGDLKTLSRVFSNTTVQKHQFLGAQLSL